MTEGQGQTTLFENEMCFNQYNGIQNKMDLPLVAYLYIVCAANDGFSPRMSRFFILSSRNKEFS